MAGLAKGVHRDGLEPGLRHLPLPAREPRAAHRPGWWRRRRSRRTCRPSADRCRTARTHSRAPRCCSRRRPAAACPAVLPAIRFADRGGAGFGLGVGGGGGFRNAAADAGVADDVDVRHQFRGKRHRIDRAPAGVVGRARDLGDAAGLLRRDHVGDLRSVIAEIGDDGVGRGIDRRPPGRLATATPARSCRDTIPSRHSRTGAAAESHPWRRGSMILRARLLALSDNARSGWRVRTAPADSAKGWRAPRARPCRHRPWLRAAGATAWSARPPSRHAAFLQRPPRHSRAARRTCRSMPGASTRRS